MMKNLFLRLLGLIYVFFVLFDVNAQAPNITSLSFNKTQLNPYEKLEITLTLSRQVVRHVNNGNRNDDTASRIGKYGFPHSDSDVMVRAFISKPGSGYYFSVNGFYNQDFFFGENNCTERPYFNGTATYPAQFHSEKMYPTIRPNATDNWKIRYTPDTVLGVYLVKIAVSDKYSFDINGNRLWKYKDTFFTVMGAPVSEGFIRVLEGRKRYLYRERTKEMEYLSGAAGHFLFYANEYSCAMIEALQEYKANNINFFRIWIDGIHPWEGTRLSLVGYDRKEAAGGAVFTRIFNQMNSKRLDTLFDIFEANGVDFQICIFTPNLGDVGTDSATQYSPYFKNCIAYRPALPYTYRHPNIGFLTDPFDWYRKTHQLQKDLIRYAVARWGHYTNLVSWEIGNEMYPTETTIKVNESSGTKFYTHPRFRGGLNTRYMDDTVKYWHINIKNYIKQCDPYDHLVTTSLLKDIYGDYSDSSLEKWTESNKQHSPIKDVYDIPGGSGIIFNKLDFVNSHNYYTNPTCPNWDSAKRFEAQEEALWHCANSYITNNDKWSQLYKKPFMVQEWGWGDDHCGNPPPSGYADSRWEYDPNLTIVHNVLWLNLFSHSCGLPLHFDGTLPAANMQVWKGPGGFLNDLKDIPDDAVPVFTKTESYRHSTLLWPDRSYITGWCQNRQFTFANLYWNHNDYLKYMSSSSKPKFTINNNTLDIVLDSNNNLQQPRAYRVEYYSTAGGAFVYADTQFSVSGGNVNILNIKYPEFMMTSKMGDFVFKAKQICSPLQRFALNDDQYPWQKSIDTIFLHDTLKIHVTSGGFGEYDSLVITEQDSIGNPAHNFSFSEVFYKAIQPSLNKEYSFNDLPLFCDGPPNTKFRYFTCTWFTKNCENTWVSYSRKYVIKVSQPVANLGISDSMGTSFQNKASLGFAHPIWLNPNGSKNCSYLQYFVELLDSNGNFISRVNTCAENNATLNKTQLSDYLNRDGVCSPIQYLTGGSPNPKQYRVILIASQYRGCISNYNYATDTCWFEIGSCQTYGRLKVNGHKNSDGFNSVSVIKPDPIYLVPDSVFGATRLRYKLFWVINGQDTPFQIQNYNLELPQPMTNENITSTVESELQYAINNGLGYRISDSILFKIQYRLSNYIDGGCDTGHWQSSYFAYKRCGHIPNYKFFSQGTITESDTLTITPTTAVYIIASETFGGQYYNATLYKRSGGNDIFVGEKQGIWKGIEPGFNLQLLGNIQPLANDTGFYKIQFSSYNFDTSYCSSPVIRNKYIKVSPYSPLLVTLRDSMSKGPQKWITYCDTTDFLPIKISNLQGVDSLSLHLTEMYYYTNNIWGMLRIYVKPLSKYYFMRWSDYGKPVDKSLLELNSFSLVKRQLRLEKDKRWMLFVHIARNGIVKSDTFRFYYTQNCSSPPPPEAAPMENPTISNDEDSIKVVDENGCIVYPNPGMGECIAFCNTQIISAQLLDANGRSIGLPLRRVQYNLHTFDTEGLSAGLYFVHLIYANSKTLCVPWVKM